MRGSYNPKEVRKQSIILGIYFNLTYTTYLSFSCIITFIAQNEEGQYNYAPLVALAVNYSVYMITLIFSPIIKNYKWQFQVSAIFHLINYLVYIPNFKEELGLVAGIIGALFGGYGAAVYWVSQGGYMVKLFQIYKIPQNQQGSFFGITNGIVYGSSFFGALITTFGLGLFGTQVYFIILSVFALISWVVCTFFLDSLDVQKQYQQQQISQSLMTEKRTIIVIQQKVNLIIQLQQTFIKTMKYYPKMWYMFCIIILDGIISSYIGVSINKLIVQEQRTKLNVGFLLMAQGIGCIFGAITSSFSSDKFHVLNVGKAGTIAIIITAITTYINSIVQLKGLFFALIIGFCWGFVINFLTSWQSVCCTKVNKGCLQSFSIVRQLQSLTYISFLIAMIFTENTLNLSLFLLMMIIICIIAFISLLIFQKNDIKRQDLSGTVTTLGQK